MSLASYQRTVVIDSSIQAHRRQLHGRQPALRPLRLPQQHFAAHQRRQQACRGVQRAAPIAMAAATTDKSVAGRMAELRAAGR